MSGKSAGAFHRKDRGRKGQYYLSCKAELCREKGRGLSALDRVRRFRDGNPEGWGENQRPFLHRSEGAG